MSSSDTGVGWIDPDDAPELMDDWFAKATYNPARRGLGTGIADCLSSGRVSVEVDAELVARLQAQGADWQARIDAALGRLADRRRSSRWGAQAPYALLRRGISSVAAAFRNLTIAARHGKRPGAR